MTTPSEVRVWDPLIRVFHWATVTLCLLNFFILEEGSKPHKYAGYAVGILLIIRLLWGMVGPHYARFGQWWPTPARIRYYLRQLAQGRHPYYLGHNPVGALMIWLLLSLVGTVVTGWLTTWDAFWGEDWLEELHEVVANTLMAAVGVHAVPADAKVEDPRSE